MKLLLILFSTVAMAQIPNPIPCAYKLEADTSIQMDELYASQPNSLVLLMSGAKLRIGDFSGSCTFLVGKKARQEVAETPTLKINNCKKGTILYISSLIDYEVGNCKIKIID